MLKPVTQKAHEAIFGPLAIIVNERKAVSELPKTMRGIRYLDIWCNGHCRLTYTYMGKGQKRWFSIDGQPHNIGSGKEIIDFMREWLAWYRGRQPAWN